MELIAIFYDDSYKDPAPTELITIFYDHSYKDPAPTEHALDPGNVQTFDSSYDGLGHGLDSECSLGARPLSLSP